MTASLRRARPVALRIIHFSMSSPVNVVLSALLACALLTAGCQDKSADHHHTDDNVEESPNKALYDEVMAVHDEVMPKMNDLYKAKTELRKQLGTPDLSEAEKQAIHKKIAQIEAADEGMMVWMRQFEPIPDSAGEKKAREYLESELIKVKKVKEDILQALQQAMLEH